MNALQIRELKRRAKLESEAEINEGKNVYCIYKPMTCLAKVTTDERIFKIFTEVYGFVHEATFLNGQEIA